MLKKIINRTECTSLKTKYSNFQKESAFEKGTDHHKSRTCFRLSFFHTISLSFLPATFILLPSVSVHAPSFICYVHALIHIMSIVPFYIGMDGTGSFLLFGDYQDFLSVHALSLSFLSLMQCSCFTLLPFMCDYQDTLLFKFGAPPPHHFC